MLKGVLTPLTRVSAPFVGKAGVQVRRTQNELAPHARGRGLRPPSGRGADVERRPRALGPASGGGMEYDVADAT